MLRARHLLCLLALLLGLSVALPVFAADYEDIFLANVLVARLRDPGKFASLAERAAKVESLLIEVLSTQDTMNPVVQVKLEAGSWVVYSGPVRVLTVLPKDATGSGMPAKSLAQTWANNLKKQLPLATPPSRMGAAAPRGPAATPPAATPPVAPPPAAVPAVPAPPAVTPPSPPASPPAALPVAPSPIGSTMDRQAALLVLLDALNQARGLPEDQYLAQRQGLANAALAKLQAFLAGQPVVVPPAGVLPSSGTPITPPTTEPTPVSAEPVPGLPQITPLPADIAKLPVAQRVSRKFEVAAGPYQALRNSNPALYAQVGTLLAEARQAKAAYHWEDAEGYLDGALAMLGFRVG